MPDLQQTFTGPIAAWVYLVPTLVWAILAEDACSFRLLYRPKNPLYGVLPFCTLFTALFFALYIPISLSLPLDPAETRPPRWFDLGDVALALSVATFRHLTWYFRQNPVAPSRVWLAVNYGVASFVGLVNLAPEVLPVGSLEVQFATARSIVLPYALLMLGLSLRHVSSFARRGGWRPGGNELRSADLIVVGLAVAGVIILLGYYAVNHQPWDAKIEYTPAPPLLSAGIGLLLAMPFGARIFGDLVKRFLGASLVIGLSALGFFGVQMLLTRIPEPLHAATSLGGACALVLVILYVQPWLRAAIDQVLFRRGLRRRAELQAALHLLSPELGVHECARRAIEAFVRVLGLRGAALLFTDGRGSVAAGAIQLEPLERIWDDGATMRLFPPQPFSIGMFRELPTPVQDALSETEVVGAAPITSPRRDWGTAFITTGALRATFSEDDRAAIRGLIEQLGLLLDSAELLERTVEVERSLAHSEKLAAIGELAARVAHEIRNPITAASSLAQLVAEDPQSPDNAESAQLILTELQRVERQVADLLRFARREDLQLEATDVGALVRETVDAFRPRLGAADIRVSVEAADGLVVQADRDKIRQVLINLIENSIDAIRGQDRGGALALDVSRHNGCSTIRVADDGPGVAADTLGRLFEPFFSLKTQGTGLGLAIVKRTIEAHGGTVAARANEPAGMRFEIDLPLASTTDEVQP